MSLLTWFSILWGIFHIFGAIACSIALLKVSNFSELTLMNKLITLGMCLVLSIIWPAVFIYALLMFRKLDDDTQKKVMDTFGGDK